MKHVMVDLETFASRHDAAIVSIGAVCFDPETATLGPEFKTNVIPQSSQAAGLYVDAETMQWWFSQPQEVRDAIRRPSPVPLGAALESFRAWLRDVVDVDFQLWGNGATFDNVILRNAYRACDIPVPWKHNRDACYRTMKNQFPQISLVREGTHHDSLADAKSQAIHLNTIFAALRVGALSKSQVKA